jgi:putative component of membrane protein insertase Oxa1/YidC/SpoIIIJ protein YidD
VSGEKLRRRKIKCPGKALARAVFLLVSIAFYTGAFAGESEHAPVFENNDSKEQGAAVDFALAPVHFYQKYLSPVIGGRCPMYPSCSGYAKQAITKHGSVLGWIMTCDRLMRCGRDELTLSPEVHEAGVSYCRDPVENNDFWLK